MAAPASNSRPPMKWWESLRFRFSLIQAALLLLIVGATVAIMFTVERSLLLEQGYSMTEDLGGRMVSELEERIAKAEALSSSLANLGETLDRDVDQFMRVVPRVMNYAGEGRSPGDRRTSRPRIGRRSLTNSIAG